MFRFPLAATIAVVKLGPCAGSRNNALDVGASLHLPNYAAIGILVVEFLMNKLYRHAQHRQSLRQWQRRDGRHHKSQLFVCCCVHFCPARE